MSNDRPRDSLVQNFLNFFPGGKSDKPGEAGARAQRDKTIVVQGVEEVARLIESVVSMKNPINIILSSDTQQFSSHFEMDPLPVMAAMRRGEYLLLAPLTPPIGNIKIRQSSGLTLNFFTDIFVVEARVTFIRFLEDRTLKVSFPNMVVRGPQKRNYARVTVDPKWNLMAEVIRPSGVPLAVKIYDISGGGCSFFPQNPAAELAEGAKITVILNSPNTRRLELVGKVLKSVSKGGKKCFRASFAPNNREVQENLEEIVQNLIQRHARKRTETFS